MNYFAIVLAGGVGKRLWPLSQGNRPKQLLAPPGFRLSLLELAMERFRSHFDSDHVFISTSSSLVPQILALEGIVESQIITEPTSRNTMGALVYAIRALLSQGATPEETVIVLGTSDHQIHPIHHFGLCIKAALDRASQGESLITIGIPPNRPETDYGYIEVLESTSETLIIQKAVSFRENPPLDRAIEYLAAGQYLWNSGMLVARLDFLIQQISFYAPEHFNYLQSGYENSDQETQAFEQWPSISIDKAILEKCGHVEIINANFSWDDLGSWEGLQRAMELQKDSGNNVTEGSCVIIDSNNNFLYNETTDQRLIAIDVQDLIIVTTESEILVCRKGSQSKLDPSKLPSASKTNP